MVDSVAGLDAWVILLATVTILLTLDLFVIGRRGGTMSFPEASLASVFWITIALLFGVFVFFFLSADAGKTYFSGYLIEKSLSLDNVFVFLIVMSSFAIPFERQHRLLTFGIIGALILRAFFIFIGASALAAFSWISFPFAAILLWTGYKLFRHRHDHEDEGKLVEKIYQRLPIKPDDSGRLWQRIQGKRYLTPAGGALIGIVIVDILFAVDSIPAILAITTDVYIVVAANAFALLGLRPLFFVVADLISRLYYLKTALAALLIFVGFKIVFQEVFAKIDPIVSLFIIVTILAGGVIASLLREKRMKQN